jgi:radical SAM superfamily enzyme YgiQ (UPF0313 family)
MRDVINKNVCEEDVLKTSHLIFTNGWNSVKFYFMIGLPYETMEDVLGIKDLAFKVQDTYYKIDKPLRPKGARITVSTSSFVPKPFTPFMWARQDTMEELREKQDLLKNEMKSKLINYNWHDADLSILEGVFARGDRRLSKVLIDAYKKGCRLDGWNEHFKYDKWMEAFSDNNIDYSFYNHRERDYEENLPWDFIDVGVSKNFLKKENEKAKILVDTIKELGKNIKLYIKIQDEDVDKAQELNKLFEVLKDKEGDIPVYVYFEQDKDLKMLSRQWWIEPSEQNILKLKNIYGEDNIKLV